MDERYSKAVQYIALIATVLVCTGDSVETYLPAVITQPVSCELNISKTKESVLAIFFYITSAISVFLSIPCADYFGRRTTFLVSLYSTVIFTVLCAAVPNYVILLILRLLIGFAVGLNHMVNLVYVSGIADNKESYILGTTCIHSRVYQNLAISSENYRTFPKVGLHYKERACKCLARSDNSLRPNSCVLFEIFVTRRKISTAQ